MPSPPLVIGIGTEERGDDGAGLVAARALRGRVPGRARIVESHGDAAELLELFRGSDSVWLIDAVRSGRAAGTVLRLVVGESSLPSVGSPTSTHAFSVAQAVGLGAAFGELPKRLILYGVEAGSFAPGIGLSDAVRRGVDEIVLRLAGELADRGS